MAYLIVRYSQKTGNPVSENSLLFGTGTINSPVTVVRSARKQPLRRIPGILSDLNIHNVEQRLRFGSAKTHDFAEGLQYVINYIMSNLDLNGKLIFEGKYWIDFPFDWHEYK